MIRPRTKPSHYAWAFHEGRWVVQPYFSKTFGGFWTDPDQSGRSTSRRVIFTCKSGEPARALLANGLKSIGVFAEQCGIGPESIGKLTLVTTTVSALKKMPTPCQQLIAKGFDALSHIKVIEEDKHSIKSVTLPFSVTDTVIRRGPMIYLNLPKKATSVHSLDALHGTFVPILAECRSTWGWNPPSIELFCHTHSASIMGLAFNPGNSIARRVSLSDHLLTRYDLAGVGRVFAHELCHHAREELKAPSKDPHDALFVEMLAMVDPLVKTDPSNALGFRSTVLNQVAAAESDAIAVRKAALVSGNLQIALRSLKGGTVSVSLMSGNGRPRKVGNLSDVIIDEVMKAVGSSDIWDIPVTSDRASSDRPNRKGTLPGTRPLGVYLFHWAEGWPTIMGKLPAKYGLE